MENMQDDWQLSTGIRYFLAVAENGSLSAASKRLFVAASAISRQIQHLEEHVGTALFERQPRGMQLTDAGKILRRYEERSQQQLQQTLAEIRYQNTGYRHRIRIASSEGVAFKLLPHLIKHFVAQHSNIYFHIDVLNTEEIPARMIEDNYDVGLQFSIYNHKDINVIDTFSAPILALVRRDHPLAESTVRLADLKQWPMILPDEISTVRQLFNFSCRIQNINIEPVVVCDSFATQYNTIAQYPGAVGLCSKQTLMGGYTRDGLTTMEITDFELQKRVLHIRAGNDWQERPLLNEFLTFSREEIRRLSHNR